MKQAEPERYPELGRWPHPPRGGGRGGDCGIAGRSPCPRSEGQHCLPPIRCSSHGRRIESDASQGGKSLGVGFRLAQREEWALCAVPCRSAHTGAGAACRAGLAAGDESQPADVPASIPSGRGRPDNHDRGRHDGDLPTQRVCVSPSPSSPCCRATATTPYPTSGARSRIRSRWSSLRCGSCWLSAAAGTPSRTGRDPARPCGKDSPGLATWFVDGVLSPLWLIW